MLQIILLVISAFFFFTALRDYLVMVGVGNGLPRFARLWGPPKWHGVALSAVLGAVALYSAMQ